MACEWDAHPSMGFMVKRGQREHFVQATEKVYDELPASAYPQSESVAVTASMELPATANRAPLIISSRPDQDVVVDTRGVAYSVRVHLSKHLHMNQRVEKLERAVAALQGQVHQQQSVMHDLRREKFVTQGAFMAAQLCKADVGPVKSQRRKLEHVCKLLVSAGILDDSIGDGLSVREQDTTICKNTTANGETEAKMISLQNDIVRIDEVANAVSSEAQHALRIAEDATSAMERSERECRQMEERYSTVSVHFAKVREEAKEDRERIETNSTRLFRLVAEVENLSERKRCSGYAGPSMYRSREETGYAREEAGYVSEVEIADHSFTQTDLSPSESSLPSTTEEEEGAPAETPTAETPTVETPTTETSTVDREESLSSANIEAIDEGDPEVGQGTKVEATLQEHAPRRPGVLDAPGGTEPQQSARAAFVSAYAPAAFPASSRRATRIGRRGVTENIQEHNVEPVRPCLSRPSKARPIPCSWKRGSWPLLGREVGRIRVGAVGEGADDADHVKHMTRERFSMPNLTWKCTTTRDAPNQDENMEGLSAICTGDATVGDHHDEAQNSAGRQEDAGLSVSDCIAHLRDLGSPRTTSPQHPSDGMTTPTDDSNKENDARWVRGKVRCLESFESFQPLADNEKRRDRDGVWGAAAVAETNYGTITLDDEGRVDARRSGPRGAGLVYLEGAPTLWCPRDTWEAVESSARSNSSTSGRHGEDSATALSGTSITGKTDQP